MSEVRTGGMVFFSAPSRRTLRLCGEIPGKEKPARRRRDRKGRAEFVFRQTPWGAFICETETLKRLFLQPFAAVNHFGAAGQHHFTIVAPLNLNHAAGGVHVHTPIRLTVNDRGDNRGAGTGA